MTACSQASRYLKKIYLIILDLQQSCKDSARDFLYSLYPPSPKVNILPVYGTFLREEIEVDHYSN